MSLASMLRSPLAELELGGGADQRRLGPVPGNADFDALDRALDDDQEQPGGRASRRRADDDRALPTARQRTGTAGRRTGTAGRRTGTACRRTGRCLTLAALQWLLCLVYAFAVGAGLFLGLAAMLSMAPMPPIPTSVDVHWNLPYPHLTWPPWSGGGAGQPATRPVGAQG